jgi:hypothetical protein
MPYIRTARAWAWIDTPTTESPRTPPDASAIRWASTPLPSAHGLCIGVAKSSLGMMVAVKRSTSTLWLASNHVLTDSQLDQWLSTGFK